MAIGKQNATDQHSFLFLLLFLLYYANSAVNAQTDTTSISDFRQSFRIVKSDRDSSRFLDVFLPEDFGEYREFIARVVDVTKAIESSIRDGNRTFRLTPQDPTAIRIHGLSPGHRYSLAIIGRVGEQSVPIKEESLLMVSSFEFNCNVLFQDPAPLNLDAPGSITVSHHNVTLRAVKEERAVQDKFTVKYFQLDPLKRYPTVDVYDLVEQRDVEIYLGNLSPGRDFDVSVTSVVSDIQSIPWRRVITTKPLQPQNLSVVDMNGTCVTFRFDWPAESGVDRFKIAYGQMNSTENMVKTEIAGLKPESVLCNGIHPGMTFVFAVIAEKTRQISEPSTITHTVRPLPPISVSVTPDFDRGQFAVEALLPPQSISKSTVCHIVVVSDRSDKVEQRVRVGEISENKCVAFVDLTPGRRYDISVAALSAHAQSTKALRSTALEPAFDHQAFGIAIQETKGTLKIEWPSDEAKSVKLKSMWDQIVGNGSKLHVRIDPVPASNREESQQFDLLPESEIRHVQADHLLRGACYRIQIYAVTSSGIVSTQKFVEMRRLAPPAVDVRVERISKSSAVVRIAVLAFIEDPRHPVVGDSTDCSLNLIVVDAFGEKVLDRRLSFAELSAPSVHLDGLRPFHKYHLRPKVICGVEASGPSVCASNSREMPDLVFRTQADRPGAVEQLTAHPLNSHSVQLSWISPKLPNGIISHYVVRTLALNGNPESWTMNVDGNQNSNATDSGQTLQTAVVNNLIGGLNYRFDVTASNEAGAGFPLATDQQAVAKMPIAAPPQPNAQIELVADSIRSTELTVRYTNAGFDPQNGLLSKVALIVSQVGPDGRSIFEEIPRASNQSMITWGRAQQKYEFWPPYVATITPLEQTVRPLTQTFLQTIGSDTSCIEKDIDEICNGPLKAGTSYRFKLRLFTSPELWTDSVYSDIVTTEPLNNGGTFRGVFVVLCVFVCCALLALFLLELANGFSFRNVPRRANPTQNSKESQWAALKMIMTERTTECLSKLGLVDTNGSPPAQFSAQNPSNNSPNVHFASAIATNGQLLQVNNGGSTEVDGIRSPPKDTSGSSPFNAHHRRSRSLRERTGVDQRLERLPSGPPASSEPRVLWTVMENGINVKQSRPVRVSDFSEHFRLMSADSDYLFSTEYEEFRFVGNGQTCIAAELGPNRAKNRFTNILPYDHSRVKLMTADDEDGSDYINASFISGFNSRREFIAAQGPLPSTRDHFWKVVWEQECPAIVALTKCVEKGRDKCHRYWPDANQPTVLYMDIEVTLLNEALEYDEYTIRQFRLVNLAEPNQPARIVIHFHFQAWPDFGAPDHPVGIVNFLRLFRTRLPPSPLNRPTVVHCSAGVGRSGTFIALDRLVQTIPTGRPLDVFGTVYEMRQERCQMVQNESQYIFIHVCLLYVLQNFYPQLLAPQYPAGTGFNFGPSTSSNLSTWSTVQQQSGLSKTPRIEVHQNPAFNMHEDDDGIAESVGL
ncbi:Protein-tyrosine-phosphatase [Aphelenchoides besseyi]|nr:Protein-tyrosine-phosphatase [Aphelenchoides besseyi]